MKRSTNPSAIDRKFPGSQFSAILVLICMLICSSGCSSLNGTRLENILGADTNLINFSATIADHLIDSALPPLVPRHPDMPILVTTFVDNNDLKKTSHFGRILQEHITSRLVQRGYTVKEMKLSSTLNIEPQSGETILTRDLAQLKKDQEVQAVLAGTISRTDRVLYVSARLINPVNNTIIATDDNRLIMDNNIMAMFGLRRQDKSDLPIADPGQPFLNSIL